MLNTQGEEKEWLEGLKQNNELKQTIEEMVDLRKIKYTGENKWLNSVADKADYFYDYYNEEFKDILSAQVNFYLNPHTKIWKIVW